MADFYPSTKPGRPGQRRQVSAPFAPELYQVTWTQHGKGTLPGGTHGDRDKLIFPTTLASGYGGVQEGS